jgi:starvation-inducible DNA-binding protein
MTELTTTLNVLLANQFVAYFKAQTYHWNTEGIDFPQYHKFFRKLYEDFYGAVDPTAEYLRILGEYAPVSFMEMYNYKTISEDSAKPATIEQMLTNIGEANQALIENLNKLFDVASQANEQGIADWAAARLDAHKKHAWMIRSCLKKSGE